MNFANRQYQEKRNFIRMRVDTPVSVHVLTDDQHSQGICRNLSGGGMLLELPATLPVGTQAAVSIKSTHGHSPMLQARVRVARVDAHPNSSEQPCLLGMVIEEVLNEHA